MILLFVSYNPNFYDVLGLILFSFVFLYALYRIIVLVGWFIYKHQKAQEEETEFIRKLLKKLDEDHD